MGYRADIQILRGIAVLIVLLFHFEISGFKNGFLGVDIFFVLSGYLMALLYNKGTVKEFYIRRLKRLLPAYLITIGITTFVVACIAVPSDANQRFARTGYDFLGLSNVAFWTENAYFNKASFKPLLNLWSLGVELQYYLIVPLLLPIVRKSKILLYLAIIGSVLATFFLTTVSPKTSFFMMPFRVWEFLIGTAVAWSVLPTKIESRAKLPSILLIGGLFIMLLYPIDVIALSATKGHPGLASLIISLIMAAILIKPLHSIFSGDNILGKTFIKLGDYSYSIYLVHFPIIVLVNYQAFGGTKLGYSNMFDLSLMVGLTAIFSFLMFKYVEGGRYKVNFFKKFAALILVSGALSASAIFINGARFSEEQKIIFMAWTDRAEYRCGKIFRLLNPKKNICIIGDGEFDKSVLLIGNSHADSLKVSFSEVMSDNGLGTLFYVSNAPLLTPQVNAKAIVQDSLNLGVDNLVIHFSPIVYEDSNALSEMVKLRSLLNDIGKSIFFIAPVPIYDEHIPEALYKKTINPELDVKKKSLEDYMHQNMPFITFVESQKIPSDHVYWPHKQLCSEHPSCMIQSDGGLFYFDRGHLTLTGAEALKPELYSLASKMKK